eukprot:1185653-Prorocentrum_minimum.AAC.1
MCGARGGKLRAEGAECAGKWRAGRGKWRAGGGKSRARGGESRAGGSKWRAGGGKWRAKGGESRAGGGGGEQLGAADDVRDRLGVDGMYCEERRGQEGVQGDEVAGGSQEGANARVEDHIRQVVAPG